jgi:hypothetical protein
MQAAVERQAKNHAAEIAAWPGELELLASELAGMRSLDRLRHSREGRPHKAQVELRPARQALERETKGTNHAA